MNIIAVDPGRVRSAVVEFDTGTHRPMSWTISENVNLRISLHGLGQTYPDSVLVIEQFKSYGATVGDDVLMSVLWSGRFIEAFGGEHCLIPRATVKGHICHDARAKDSNVRQALIDYFGGRQTAIGGKKCPACHGKGWRGRSHEACTPCAGTGWEYPPGPLAGITTDMWSALALAVAYADGMGAVSTWRNPGGDES